MGRDGLKAINTRLYSGGHPLVLVILVQFLFKLFGDSFGHQLLFLARLSEQLLSLSFWNLDGQLVNVEINRFLLKNFTSKGLGDQVIWAPQVVVENNQVLRTVKEIDKLLDGVSGV